MTDKQTAVQHLMQWLSYYNPEVHAELIVKGHYQDAIEMEREQIIDAYYQCGKDNFEHIKVINRSATEYFTDTYQTEP